MLWAALKVDLPRNPVDPVPDEPCFLGWPNPQDSRLTTDYQLPPQYLLNSWFNNYGRIDDPTLRFYAAQANTKLTLTSAVKVFLGIPIITVVIENGVPVQIVAPAAKGYGAMLAQLAVTGRKAFASFAAWHPQDADLVQEVIAAGAASPADLQAAVRNVLDFAYGALWAIRANDAIWRAARVNLGWIATSGEDDLPHRPVNVPSAPYPQFDLDVVIPSTTGPAATVTTRYIVARTGNRLLPPPQSNAPLPPPPQPPNPGRALPVTGTPSIPPGDKIFIYIHGGSSRLEESIRFVDQLLAEGTRQGQSYTVIAMDLLNSGYSTPVDHTRIAEDTASYRPDPDQGDRNAAIPAWPAPTYGYPMMDAEEQFILSFIDALDAEVGNIKNRIAAVMGGSLGGNMAVRLGRRANTSSFLNTTVAWSVTCMRPLVTDFEYQGVKGNNLGLEPT
jgi:hypothetical protein